MPTISVDVCSGKLLAERTLRAIQRSLSACHKQSCLLRACILESMQPAGSFLFFFSNPVRIRLACQHTNVSLCVCKNHDCAGLQHDLRLQNPFAPTRAFVSEYCQQLLVCNSLQFVQSMKRDERVAIVSQTEAASVFNHSPQFQSRVRSDEKLSPSSRR